jgi:hypothetical protein
VVETPPEPPVVETPPAPTVAEEPLVAAPAAETPPPPAAPPVEVPVAPAAAAADQAPAAAATIPPAAAKPKPKPKPAAPPPPPPAKRGFISSFFKPPGGPIKVAQRVGILVLVVIVLATVGVLGFAAIRSGSTNVDTTGTGSGSTSTATATATPTPTSGPKFITYNDPVNEFSIPRPQDWVARGLASPDANIAMIVGPDAPYPIADFVAVTVHKLPFALGNQDLAPFKDFILELLGSDINLIGQNPSPAIDGHAGYFFTWSYPKTAPTTLHQAYYLIDGDRFVTILLQIEPPTDSNSLSNLSPTFQSMAQGFKSYHKTPSPTATVTSPATATSTPSPSASASP